MAARSVRARAVYARGWEGRSGVGRRTIAYWSFVLWREGGYRTLCIVLKGMMVKGGKAVVWNVRERGKRGGDGVWKRMRERMTMI